jgi:hypothetical protein
MGTDAPKVGASSKASSSSAAGGNRFGFSDFRIQEQPHEKKFASFAIGEDRSLLLRAA